MSCRRSPCPPSKRMRDCKCIDECKSSAVTADTLLHGMLSKWPVAQSSLCELSCPKGGCSFLPPGPPHLPWLRLALSMIQHCSHLVSILSRLCFSTSHRIDTVLEASQSRHSTQLDFVSCYCSCQLSLPTLPLTTSPTSLSFSTSICHNGPEFVCSTESISPSTSTRRSCYSNHSIKAPQNYNSW